MKRGEVRWREFKAPDKRRPVVILSRNSTLDFLNAVTVAPITTNLRELPSHVYLDETDGLLKPCNVTLHSIVTVDKRTIGKFIASLSQERMEEIENAISHALGFGDVVG